MLVLLARVVFVSELVTVLSFVGFRYAKKYNWMILVGEIPFSSFKLKVSFVHSYPTGHFQFECNLLDVNEILYFCMPPL